MAKQNVSLELEEHIIELSMLVNLLQAWADSTTDLGEVIYLADKMQETTDKINKLLG